MTRILVFFFVFPKCDSISGVAQLSTQLVQQWLMIVKGTAGQIQQQQVQAQSQPQLQSIARKTSESEDELKDIVSNKNVKSEKVELKSEVLTEEGSDGISPGLFYKTSGKDGKLVIKKLDENNARKEQDGDTADDTESSEDRRDVKDKGKIKSKSSKSSSSSSKSRSGGKDENKSIKDSDKEKDKDRRKSSSSSSKSSSHSSSKYSSSSKSRDEKDKDRHRDRDKVRDRSKDSDKDRHRSNGSLKSSSSSKSSKNKDKKSHRDKDRESARDKSKHDDKDKQAEKDNNTLEKLKPPTIDKLGRIPKKTPSVDEKTNDAALDMKKKSFSVGIRKDKENEERPKTVKVFNSKMRSTGLEEEVKPAPPRTATGSKKPTPSVQLPTIPQKRPSPPKDLRDPIVPPEKKLKMDKIEGPERPGAIKLIPPKPKRKSFMYILFILFLFFQVSSESRRTCSTTLEHVARACFRYISTLESDRVSWFLSIILNLFINRVFFYCSLLPHVFKNTHGVSPLFVHRVCVFFDTFSISFYSFLL